MIADLNVIKSRQRAWATRSALTYDSYGYCTCADDNLFRGLSPSARKDFEAGDGTELGKAGGRGKIHALHSSSALACNWFEHWRGRDLMPLGRGFGMSVRFSALALEQKLSTGLGGIGPNVDVLLTASDGTLLGIESKFCEPYSWSKSKTHLKPRYFQQGRDLWTEAGLPRCQAVADSLRTGEHDFKNLDVAQLLKHILALSRTGQSWWLCCLWFELPGDIAAGHRRELAAFMEAMGGESEHFFTLTYQELFDRMVRVMGAEDSEYVAYLRDRYMSH